MADNSFEDIVDRCEFEAKLKKYYEESFSTNRSMWNRKQLKMVLKILEEAEDPSFKRSNSHYHYFKSYERKLIDGSLRVIVRRSDAADPVVQMIPIEDFYEKLLEAHLRTGHGGRDRMRRFCSDKWKISRDSCTLFASCCRTCNRKKSTVRSGVVAKHIISDYYNKRGQVDLIDFQNCPDGEYKWLMNYRDHRTEYVHLRPLKSKEADAVAMELQRIFYEWGAPQILQSDDGCEFIALVIKELLRLYKHTTIINGRPRHPQSQGRVDQANSDVKNMIQCWMIDNDSTAWSEGCYAVAVIHHLLHTFIIYPGKFCNRLLTEVPISHSLTEFNQHFNR